MSQAIQPHSISWTELPHALHSRVLDFLELQCAVLRRVSKAWEREVNRTRLTQLTQKSWNEIQASPDAAQLIAAIPKVDRALAKAALFREHRLTSPAYGQLVTTCRQNPLEAEHAFHAFFRDLCQIFREQKRGLNPATFAMVCAFRFRWNDYLLTEQQQLIDRTIYQILSAHDNEDPTSLAVKEDLQKKYQQAGGRIAALVSSFDIVPLYQGTFIISLLDHEGWPIPKNTAAWILYRSISQAEPFKQAVDSLTRHGTNLNRLLRGGMYAFNLSDYCGAMYNSSGQRIAAPEEKTRWYVYDSTNRTITLDTRQFHSRHRLEQLHHLLEKGFRLSEEEECELHTQLHSGSVLPLSRQEKELIQKTHGDVTIIPHPLTEVGDRLMQLVYKLPPAERRDVLIRRALQDDSQGPPKRQKLESSNQQAAAAAAAPMSDS
jgi:hypothetical protein